MFADFSNILIEYFKEWYSKIKFQTEKLLCCFDVCRPEFKSLTFCVLQARKRIENKIVVIVFLELRYMFLKNLKVTLRKM